MSPTDKPSRLTAGHGNNQLCRIFDVTEEALFSEPPPFLSGDWLVSAVCTIVSLLKPEAQEEGAGFSPNWCLWTQLGNAEGTDAGNQCSSMGCSAHGIGEFYKCVVFIYCRKNPSKPAMELLKNVHCGITWPYNVQLSKNPERQICLEENF